jgi:hypothetical protein
LNRLKDLEIAIDNNPTGDIIQQHTTCKKELEGMNTEKLRGQQLRARCLHIDNFEYNSKYFLNKEISHAETENFQALELDTGEIVTGNKQIMEEQKKFYQTLYSETKINTENEIEEATKTFLDNETCKNLVSEDNAEMLDNEITMQEVAKAVQALPNGKSPGLDGIPVEIYKLFWTKIKDIVCDSLRYGLTEGKLSLDQRRGVLKLIPKKDKDIRKIKNWRPLSLLSTDYKILAKTLARRLEDMLPEIISQDQTGCIKGRSTFENLRSTIDVINYTKENNIHGILSFIDFEKAFDTVSWKFLNETLQTMNFGPYFRTCITTLYNDIETCVTNNGHLSTFFNPTRGIRQGCPISANLFVIIVEVLAMAIRRNPRIQGITINNHNFKISQYADDTVLYLANQQSLKIALIILDLFSKCTGLRMNRDKSESVWIGASSNFLHKPYELKWTNSPVKTLGLYLTKDKDEMTKINFNDKLGKIETLTKLWNLRKLTLKGKILIINTLIIPQLLYTCTVLETPSWVVEKFNILVRNFIWDGKPPKIKNTCLINTLEEGGLKLQNLKTKIDSLKFKWIKKIVDQNVLKPWKAYISDKYKDPLDRIIAGNLHMKDMPKITEDFYNSIFQMWAKLHYHEPTKPEDILTQLIWKNSLIKVDKKTIDYKSWRDREINYIQDILNNNGNIGSKPEIERKFNTTFKFLEYESLVHAIPRKWKDVIRNDQGNKNMIISRENKININNSKKSLIEITTKEVYWELLTEVAERPTSENKWTQKTDLALTEPEWKIIYTMAYRVTRDTKLINFNFKLTHRILAVGEKLKTWKINSTDKCEKCQEIDTIEHHLVQCPTVLVFWQQVFNWWESITGTRLPIIVYEIIFGIPNETNDTVIDSFNYILLCCNYYIYKSKIKKENLYLYEFLLECKNRIIHEAKSSYDKVGRDGKDKKWEELRIIFNIEYE